MEKILITQTNKTPLISANPEDGLIEIKGRSNPENSAEFYKPLIDWLDTYLETQNGGSELVIDLEHFNTSSSKCLMDVMKRLKKIQSFNRNVNVRWYYEEDDEEMLEAAETYESMTKLPFSKISRHETQI